MALIGQEPWSAGITGASALLNANLCGCANDVSMITERDKGYFEKICGPYVFLFPNRV